MTATPTPVVLLHGMRVTSSMWGPVGDRLARRRPTAHPDLPGHGTRRAEEFTVAAAVDLVRGTVAELGGPALLVGHSLGGFIAIATAARHPELVRGLVAIGCSAAPRGAGLAAYRAYGRLLAGNPERSDRLSDRGFRSQLPADVYQALAAGGYDSAVSTAVVQEIGALDPIAELGGYAGPVWLLNGGWDQFRMGESRFLDACQDGRLTVWPRLTHVSIIGQTDRLTRFVEDACAVVDHRRELGDGD